MLKSKKDVDQHVRKSFTKCKTDNERNFRGFAVAKLYYRINEFSTAQQYISGYLTVQEDNSAAYKLLGQCYQRLKKPDKALEAFQRSLQLDSKQPDILIEVCKLLLTDDNLNMNKAQYWCDLAESEKVNDDAVFNLRLKLLNKDNSGLKQMEEAIRTEIVNRPTDARLRIRLMHYFVDKDKVCDAFKYAIDLEYSSHDVFSNSAEWYNTVSLILRKYQQLPNVKRDWNYWLLLITCLERQIFLSFEQNNNSTLPNVAFTETANLLFNFDNNLQEAAQIIHNVCEEKELANQFLKHFRGQLCLHAASLLFKKEILQNKNQWRETTKISLPLLLLAYQSGSPDLQAPWLKHCGDKTKTLIQLWNKEAAFRCVQSGRCILSCIDEEIENKSIVKQVNQYINDRSPWNTVEALLFEVRQYCSDTSWRTKIFRLLFTNSDQTVKISLSHLVQNENLREPIYEIPSYADVESYEEIAQYLRPQSLHHMTYICLGKESLHQTRCTYFNGLNFSTKNLSFCGAESLNQLDLETFLYATIIQAKRTLEVERNCYESYNSKSCGRPGILPYVNIVENLCTEEQESWWTSAYQVYKNLTVDNLGEIRANLQHGIESVRGINGPKIDLIIVLKLGKIFIARANEAVKPLEKTYLEQRANNLFKLGLNMLKLQNKGVLEPFRRFFKYTQQNSSKIEREINKLAEESITYLATSYFRNSEYEEAIEEFQGIELPYAAYFQAEAYRKLDESNKTPKKTKKFYEDKARDCLNHTLTLLGNNSENNHPLNNIIQSQIKRSQFTNQISDSLNNRGLNGDSSMFADFHYSDNDYLNETGPITLQLNRSVRSSNTPQQIHVSTSSNTDLENLVKQMASTLTFLKEEFVDSIKPEISGIKKDLQEMKEKMTKIEEQVQKIKHKSSETPSRADDTSNVLDDLYIIDDEIQNQLYQSQQHQPQPNMYSTGVFPGQQRMHTPNINQQHLMNNPYINSPLYNSNYGAGNMNYFPPYMMPTQQQINQAAASVVAAQRNALGLGGYHLAYTDPLNINLSQPQLPTANQSNIPLNIDSRTITTPTNLYNLLQPNQPDNRMSHQVLPSQSANLVQPSQPTTTTIWNKTSINNQPVEKGPPHNVVITNSDPLPLQNVSTSQTLPTLSVTIPTHHIKPSLVPPNEPQLPPTNTSSTFSMFPRQNQPLTSTPAIATEIPTIAPFSFNLPKTTIASNTSLFSTSTPSSLNFSNISPKLNPATESTDENELYKSAEGEYDPRPDFKPIIPLPAEIEVKTGEENEEVLFCHRAKLFRLVEKEWKERGVGDIKILKNKINNKYRILMRRDQIHKICANHQITSDLQMQPGKNDEKCYIWVANDFADEELKVEKFCIRFKHAEKAKQFYECFNKCRDLESLQKDTIVASTAQTVKNQNTLPITTPVGTTAAPATTTGPFTFTFSNSNQKTEPISTSTKPSPFANFAFTKESTPKTQSETVKPFENIFQSFNKSTLSNNTSLFTTPKSDAEITSKGPNVLNQSASDNEDHFEPNVQFEPVIPLPAEIEITTGEENEDVLFEHRAKLFRFDKPTSEWKERGLGNIKILQDKEDKNKVRILMRRDTIHKLCCNQRLLKETNFKHPQNAKNSLQWVGQDFSDNELITETFTIRFKTADICKNFYDTILRVQNEMTDESNSKKTENQKHEAKGFGDQFKPKTGSWSCKDCYVQNIAEAKYCVSCQAPKDDTIPKKEPLNLGVDLSTKSKFSFGFGNSDTSNEPRKSENNKGFGDAFKPKTGSWDCKGCYVNNTGDQTHCVACAAPKDDTIPKKEPTNFFSNTLSTQKFSFGFNNVSTADTNKTIPPQGFGDKFKVKTGSWTCKTCYVCNTADDLICVSCKTEKNLSDPSDSNPLNQNKAGISLNSASNTTFDMSTVTATKPYGLFNFGPDSETRFATKPEFGTIRVEAPKPAFSYNNGEDGADFSLGKKEFNFQLKAKSPGKVKSPLKNNVSGADDNYESDEECVEEENNTYFTPVIPLPEKVEVVTGEENEDVLYCHRAKLYRYADKEWKERGLGDVKILRHKATKNLRVVMRREQVLKICLNHVLNSDVEYKSKDEKSWSFVVNDFTEGELKFEQFSLRFKNKEIAKDFMTNVLKALGQSNSVDAQEINDKIMNEKNINESSISDENKKIADKLMLPYSFFMEPTSACSGCRGCDPDNFKFRTINTNPEIREDDIHALPLEDQSTNSNTFGIAKNTNSFLINQSNESEKSNTRPSLFFGNDSVKNDNSNIFANIPKPVSNFSFLNQVHEENKKTDENKPSGGFLFSNNSQDVLFKNNFNKDATTIFGGGSIFGNLTSNVEPTKINENKPNEKKESEVSESVINSNGGIFAGSTIFGSANKTTALNATPIFGGTIFGGMKPAESTFNKLQPLENTTTFAKLDDKNGLFKSSGFADFSTLAKSAEEKPAFVKPSDNSSTNFIGLKNEPAKNMSAYGKLDENNGLFTATGFVDFSSLAKSTDQKPAFLSNNDSGTTNFIGLTHQNAFSSFDKANKSLNTSNPNESGTGGEEDGNYDPHYEPIIDLPKEIVVSTGEENEEKIYGERAKLYRYDSDAKEWKERGVGELKILYHPINRSYRLILRREQIHKLVLNHAIGVDFQMAPMLNSPKAFVWGAVNYAEEPSQTERLAVRFKNSDLATKFETKIKECLEELKKTHADLEPEED